MEQLCTQQINAYHHYGYLCPIDIFSPVEAAQHRAALEEQEVLYGDDGLSRPINQYRRVNAHLVSEVTCAAGLDPRILDAVESLLGPDLMLWSCEYFIKEARADKIVSWHQDLTYWGVGETGHEVTSWVALSPATSASGCMRFVPGSHRQSIVEHIDTFADDNLLSRGQEIAVEVDESDSVAATLQPGQMSLHHGRMFHASGSNVSDERRIGFAMRFIRPDTPVSGKTRDYAMLVRGCDRARNSVNIIPPSGSFTPVGLAMYEEVLAAQSTTLAEGAAEEVSLYDIA